MTTRDQRQSWAWWQKAIYLACAVTAGLAAYALDTLTGRRA